jgi:predicted transposase/invertase (TIGR01784 family)
VYRLFYWTSTASFSISSPKKKSTRQENSPLCLLGPQISPTHQLNLNHKGIKQAVELIDYDKLSPETRHLMKIAEQRKVVRNLDQEKARKEIEKVKKEMEKAKKESKEEGKEEKAEEIAKKMKNKGTEIDFISEITGLSKEKIEKL